MADTNLTVFALVLVGVVYPCHWLLIWKTEGPFWTTCLSMAGFVGDFFLILVCVTVAYVLQEHPETLPWWSNRPLFHGVMAFVAFISVGAVIYKDLPQGRWSDWYHTWVVSMGFALLLTSGVPPVVGALFEPWETVPSALVVANVGILGCFLVFGLTFWVDVDSGILDQPAAWVRFNGSPPPKRFWGQLRQARRNQSTQTS